jgi:L-lactate dehydrogenase complex protein LldG
MGPPESYAAHPLGERANPNDRPARFKEELELVGGKVTIASSLADVHASLRGEIAFWKARRIVSWAASEFAGWELGPFFLESSSRCFRPSAVPEEREGFQRAALEADMGITTVDFAIVNTGTLALTSGPGRPRSVSLLPTLHLALVRETQLVDRLAQAFTGFRQRLAALASAVHFITGPSRTSDIENDLSIGVHGPAAVSVILWRDASPGQAGS